HVRDKSIGLRALLPRLGDDDGFGAVDLIERDQLGAQRLRHAAAVLHHVFAHVARARPAIERGEDAFAHAARAAEEAVRHAQIVRAQNQHAQNPGGSGAVLGRIASTLNNVPISSGLVSRSAPERKDDAAPGSAPARRAMRCAMPRSSRNAPWLTGPCTAAADAATARAEKST